jgi:hypothetical protein
MPQLSVGRNSGLFSMIAGQTGRRTGRLRSGAARQFRHSSASIFIVRLALRLSSLLLVAFCGPGLPSIFMLAGGTARIRLLDFGLASTRLTSTVTFVLAATVN